MKVLALETSTFLGGAAVVIDGRVVAEETSRRQRSHSELLHVFIQNVLQKAGLELKDIDAFAVGLGPGSFTGIRVAGNAGKTFAETFDKPLVAIDTLTQIASQVQDKSRPVLVLLNAFKNMVYFGLFDVSGPEVTFIKGPGAVPLRDMEQELGILNCTVVGDGWTLAQQFVPENVRAGWVREREPHDDPAPGNLGILATKSLSKPGRVFDWKSFTPLYIRASEAEENLRGRMFIAQNAKGSNHGENS